MTKKELIAEIMKESGRTGPNHLPVADIETILDALALIVASDLARCHDFTLPGIAKFKLVEAKARKGRNPATGAAVDIPAKLVVKVKAVKTLNDAIARRNTMEVA